MSEANPSSSSSQKGPAGGQGGLPGETRWMQRVKSHFPPGQFGRYLVVGVFNTAFGYGAYAGLTALLTPHIRFAYVLASIIANFLAITFSFLNYKWFIFKTKGNYLREWSRCVAVYGGAMVTGTVLLPVVVFLVRHVTGANRSAPYIAFALLMGLTTTAGFLGHKNFSFAPAKVSGQRPL